MAISHVKSITLADFTGTVTALNSQASTTTVAASALGLPSDWNSAHNLYFTVGGNTTQGSTFSGTDLQFHASGNNLSVGATGGTIYFSAGGNATVNTYIPIFPGSTTTQTAGAIGVTTASALFFPQRIYQDLAFNHIKFPFSASLATTTVAASQTITSNFGIYSVSGATLSTVDTGSFSIAISQSSVSGTISFPTSTGTGGYGYGTSTWSTTANAQSLIGTAGLRAIDLQFGNTLALAPGMYYFGIHQRQATAGAAAGLSTAMIGNAIGSLSNMGAFGNSTANFTSNSLFHVIGGGVYTSTGSAGYSGTNLPSSVLMSGLNWSVANQPLITFMSS